MLLVETLAEMILHLPTVYFSSQQNKTYKDNYNLQKQLIFYTFYDCQECIFKLRNVSTSATGPPTSPGLITHVETGAVAVVIKIRLAFTGT